MFTHRTLWIGLAITWGWLGASSAAHAQMYSPGVPHFESCPQEGGWIDDGAGHTRAIDKEQRALPLFEHAFFRAEYLSWTMPGPGNTLLGEESFTVNPRGRFNIGGGQQAFVPDLSPISTENSSGGRITVGGEFYGGDAAELSGWLIGKRVGDFNHDSFGRRSILPAITGSIGNNPFNTAFYPFDQFYRVQYDTEMWGADAIYLFEGDNEGLVQFRPLIGAKYVNLQQRLNLHARGTNAEYILRMDSQAKNNVYGGQVGFRMEVVTDWLTVGLEPKAGLGANTQSTDFAASDFTGTTTIVINNSQRVTTFAPFGDVTLYATIHVNKNFTIRVGYNALWTGRVTKPEANIEYAVDPGFFTNFHLRTTRHDVLTHGLSVGGELRF